MKKKLSKSSLANASTGLSALKMGDYETAERLLGLAAKANRRDHEIKVNLGLAQQALGDVDAAAATMSEALALAPQIIDVARPLQALVARYIIPNPQKVNGFGLKAALAFDQLDRQPLVDLAFAHAMTLPDLAQALASCQTGDCDTAARGLLERRTAKGLQSEILLEALHRGKNINSDIEKLLVALRRYILLHVAPQRLQEDRAMFNLVLALISQSIHNETLWPRNEDERDALAAVELQRDAIISGYIEAAQKLSLVLMYRAIGDTALADASRNELAKIRPKALAALLTPLHDERSAEAQVAGSIKKYGTIGERTSLKVAGQYENNPYPRWSSLHVSRPGTLRTALSQFFQPEKLTFMDEPFDVLIAGCGTGQQAARAASGYGDNARLLAVDLSLASLSYGQRMSTHFGIQNVDFAQADILDIAQTGKTFDIIESIGVLHHMAEPFKGWQALIDQLKPGGLMYIGLYSAISRRDIQALRENDKHWPGAGCTDDEARAYRKTLMDRSQDEPGAALAQSRDFYALSEFRDLVLHESEQQMSIPQIAQFMEQAGLIFRGFTLPAQTTEHYLSHYPDDPFPGKLSNWDELEQTHRSLFDGMYLFWCEKAGTPTTSA